MDENVACVREKRNTYRGFGRKPGGMLPLGRLKHRWENNISMFM